ncbi:MAG: 23S rRNA (guanosine(2251)-2'-O)-methyltransferase RlmB [Rickettsiales bacterium]|nr:23S rRNA (guanosine(2251)-2'-O)-methyltransferase RlmB [Rickettsiales bacterium]
MGRTSSYHTVYGKYPVFLAIRGRMGSLVSIHTSNHRELLQFTSDVGISIDPGIIEQKNNAELSKMLGDKHINHQGYIAYFRAGKETDLHDFVRDRCSGAGKRPKLLILDELTDPHNVGAIIRTAVAFGVEYIIKTERNSPKDMSVLAKTSAGTSELVNLIEVVNINRTIEILKESGYFVLGLCGKSEKSLEDVKDMANLCLVIGSEGRGMRQLVRKNCDMVCSIKMKNTAVESLNASVAAALAIYELWG